MKITEIPQAINTSQFLKFVAIFANKFKANNGYGKWLVEYEQMDKQGLFEPENLKALYIKILTNSFKYSFVIKDAVNYICSQALDATKAYIETNTFDIRIITGEIATDDDDNELTDLSLDEALDICKAMNEEAEELLFRVYNSITNKPIK